jgi:ATP-dependent DNA ligase
MARRKELVEELAPYVTTDEDHPWVGAWAVEQNPMKNAGSRWNNGKDLSFVALRPELVVEVGYDHMEGRRFRHTTQFKRWRPDREPRSCPDEQLEVPVRYELSDVLT